MMGNSLGSCHFTERQKQFRERHVEGENGVWKLEPVGKAMVNYHATAEEVMLMSVFDMFCVV